MHCAASSSSGATCWAAELALPHSFSAPHLLIQPAAPWLDADEGGAAPEIEDDDEALGLIDAMSDYGIALGL